MVYVVWDAASTRGFLRVTRVCRSSKAWFLDVDRWRWWSLWDRAMANDGLR